jgi:hypothetical protein
MTVFVEQSMRDAYLQYLVDRKILDEVVALDVRDQQQRETPPIGRLAVVEGVLTMKQVFTIVNAQGDSDKRFGEMAIKMGFMKTAQLLILLDIQRTKRPGLNEIIEGMGLADEETLKTLRKEFISRIKEMVT